MTMEHEIDRENRDWEQVDRENRDRKMTMEHEIDRMKSRKRQDICQKKARQMLKNKIDARKQGEAVKATFQISLKEESMKLEQHYVLGTAN